MIKYELGFVDKVLRTLKRMSICTEIESFIDEGVVSALASSLKCVLFSTHLKEQSAGWRSLDVLACLISKRSWVQIYIVYH
jgi:hypothetical protein